VLVEAEQQAGRADGRNQDEASNAYSTVPRIFLFIALVPDAPAMSHSRAVPAGERTYLSYRGPDRSLASERESKTKMFLNSASMGAAVATKSVNTPAGASANQIWAFVQPQVVARCSMGGVCN